MTGRDFLDTNVLVYAYDSSDRRKQEVAMGLLRKALAGHMKVSTQVLAEFSSILLHKIFPPAPPKQLKVILNALAPIPVVTPDTDMVQRAVEVHAKYGVRFYDGMIVAAAERGNCLRIWSEDLNAGQEYFGVVVENPFRESRS
jgi:predicted nucleic acid-binding protein